MADPVSMLTSAIALLEFSISTTQKVKALCQTVSSIKNAPKEADKASLELAMILDIFENMHSDYQKHKKHLGSASKIDPRVQGTIKQLEVYCKELSDFQAQQAHGRHFCNRIKWPRRHKKINSFVESLEGFRKYFESAKSSAILQVTTALKESNQAQGERRKIASLLAWLSPLKLDELRHSQAAKYTSERLSGSGSWFLKEHDFKLWRESKGGSDESVFWCIGDAGAGKTIITSVVVHELSRNQPRDVIYFYCNHHAAKQHDATYLIGSLLKQLIAEEKYHLVPDSIWKLWEDPESGSDIPLFEKMLRELVQACERRGRTVNIVIDALDELLPETLDALRDSAFWTKCRQSRSIKLFVTSRPHLTTLLDSVGHVESQLQPRSADVMSFIKRGFERGRLGSISTQQGPAWVERTIKLVFAKSECQFLLASAHLRHLNTMSRPDEVKAAAEDLVASLDAAYNAELARISESPADAELAFQAFTWLIAAQRPMTVPELLQALATLPAEDFTDHTGLSTAPKPRKLSPGATTTKELLLRSCVGLIRVNVATKAVEFFHLSVKEHLVARNEPAEIKVVDVPRFCLSYMCLHDFSQTCEDEQAISNRLATFPFAAYVCEFWPAHVQGDPEMVLRVAMKSFLLSLNTLSFIQLLQYKATDERFFGTDLELASCQISPNDVAVYLCVFYSITKTLSILLDSGLSASAQMPWGDRYSAMHIVVWHHDLASLGILLAAKNKPDINTQDRYGLTPLHLICQIGGTKDLPIIQKLLDYGAQLDVLDQDGDTPLHIATSQGQSSYVGLLIAHGANIDLVNKFGEPPLHRAIKRGYLSISRILLDAHADPTIKDGSGVSALLLAFRLQRYELLEPIKEARTSAGDKYSFSEDDLSTVRLYQTQSAGLSEQQWKEIFEREKDQAQNRENIFSGWEAAIFYFAYKGRPEAMERMIKRGTDVNTRHPETFKTPLHIAYESRRSEVIDMLLKHGANPDLKDREGKLPREYYEGPTNQP